MLTESKYNQLMQDHAATYFRGEMAVANPSDYSLEELEAISIDMDLSTVEIDEVIKQDFQSMSLQMQEAMYDMLVSVNPELKEYWDSILKR